MRVRVRHIAVASGLWLVAIVYAFMSSAAAAAIMTAGILWIAMHIEVTENPRHNVPGQWVLTTGRLAMFRLILLFALIWIAVWGLWSLSKDQSPSGQVAALAIFGCILLLANEIDRAGETAYKFRRGGRAEQAVGESLRQLQRDRWVILHSYKRDGAGDIDHIACGPTGIYAIETKSYPFRKNDLGAVRWNAAWLKQHLDARWVTGVLCVADDTPPRLEDRVWVMGHHFLVPWLRQQRNATVARDTVIERLFEPETLVGAPTA